MSLSTQEINKMNESFEINYSPTLGKLFEAMSKVQGEMEIASKDKKNPFFKSSYTDLAGAWEVCKEHTSKNGICLMQIPEGNKEKMFLTTWVGHSSGEWMRGKMELITSRYDREKKLLPLDCQSIGAAITYARRFAMTAFLGISSTEIDDDGESAVGRSAIQEPQKLKKTPIILMNSEPVKSLGYDDFVNKFEIFPGKPMHTYVKHICKVNNKCEVEMVNAAMKNQSKFLDAFAKWTVENSQKEAVG